MSAISLTPKQGDSMVGQRLYGHIAFDLTAIRF